MISKIIDSLGERSENKKFTSLLLSKIFDQDLKSIKRLYREVINSDKLMMTDAMFN